MIENKKVLAIIPVRGGSKAIPRKNARLINGKPLTSYSIQACKKSSFIDDVYVSTDDDELKEIGLRYGAKVISRDERLCRDDVGLDIVIVETTEQIQSLEKKKYDYIVSIQATSPLLKTKSIDAAIQKIHKENLDTVISVINDNHLSWTTTNGQVVPNYKARLNRQYLPPHYKETGGFFVSSGELIKNNKTRFGSKVGLIELSKEESIDINDRFDWWVAEKALAKKRICMHIIGSHSNGLGHVYRQLTLADRISEHETYFLTTTESDLAIEKVKSHNHNLQIVKPGEELSAILKEKPDLVINDILNTDASFVKELKNNGIRVINFEDLGEGAKYCDTLINSMYEGIQIENPHHYQGIEYCCLKDEFFSSETIKIKSQVENILILFGGTDPFGMTEKVMTWLDKHSGNWHGTVILGLGKQNKPYIHELQKKLKHKFEIIENTNVISKYMAQADLAITSAGRTVYELGSLGVPCLTVASGEREVSHYFATRSKGVSYLGLAEMLTESQFDRHFKPLFESSEERSNLSIGMLSYNLKNGIENVLKLINEQLK